MLQIDIRAVKDEMYHFIFVMFIIALLLLTFVASLYAGLYETIFQSSVGLIPVEGIRWIRSWFGQ